MLLEKNNPDRKWRWSEIWKHDDDAVIYTQVLWNVNLPWCACSFKGEREPMGDRLISFCCFCLSSQSTPFKRYSFSPFFRSRNGFRTDKRADNEAEKCDVHFPARLIWHISSNDPKLVPLPDFSLSSDISRCLLSFDEGLCWQTRHLKHQQDLVLQSSNHQCCDIQGSNKL